MNRDLKLLFAGRGIHQWEIAKQLGIAEETLCRWLRKELSADKKQLILSAIETLSKEAAE